MKFKLLKDGVEINTIEANEAFVSAYCGSEGLTYEKIEEPEIIETPQPTQLDRVEAQTMYTALLTDTLIEEVV